jgi:hypothetical protein
MVKNREFAATCLFAVLRQTLCIWLFYKQLPLIYTKYIGIIFTGLR